MPLGRARPMASQFMLGPCGKSMSAFVNYSRLINQMRLDKHLPCSIKMTPSFSKSQPVCRSFWTMIAQIEMKLMFFFLSIICICIGWPTFQLWVGQSHFVTNLPTLSGTVILCDGSVPRKFCVPQILLFIYNWKPEKKGKRSSHVPFSSTLGSWYIWNVRIRWYHAVAQHENLKKGLHLVHFKLYPTSATPG